MMSPSPKLNYEHSNVYVAYFTVAGLRPTIGNGRGPRNNNIPLMIDTNPHFCSHFHGQSFTLGTRIGFRPST